MDAGALVAAAAGALGGVAVAVVTGRLRAARRIPGDQAWFWTPAWQAGEREADDDLRAGRSDVMDSEAFEDWLVGVPERPTSHHAA